MKVGDKVRVRTADFRGPPKGSIGEIMEIEGDCVAVKVEGWDKGHRIGVGEGALLPEGDNSGWWLDATEVEDVE